MADEAPLTGPLEQNRRLLKQHLGRQPGVVFRDVSLPGSRARQALIIYLEGGVDLERVEEHLVEPLLQGRLVNPQLDLIPQTTGTVTTLKEAVAALFRGEVLLQTGNTNQMYSIALAKVPLRTIDRPQTESGVYGPQETFTEGLMTNLTQIRRRLPGAGLRLEPFRIGREAPVQVVIVYLNGLPRAEMLRTLRRRLGRIHQDGLQDVSELAEGLADRRLTVFPTVLTTERPDLLCHYLMSGRIGILMENSPRALILPSLFIDFLVAADDFYEWRPFVALLRLLRLLAVVLAVPLPAFYVAVTTYHVQALPTLLTLSLLAQREGVPTPAPLEALAMTVTFEVLREAGTRLPRTLGPTVSIVGGLVIGEAAIRSGIASPAMVLIVSATAVSTFSIPSVSLANAASYMRLFLLLLTSFFGFFGLLIGYLLLVANLAIMTSLGVPYMAPSFPLQLGHLRTAVGLRPRPPATRGTKADPDLIREGWSFEERRRGKP